jgi:protein TonB
VLGTAGTLAIHLILITVGDAIIVTHPPAPWHPAPHVELVEIEVPPEIKPPPPPPPAPEPEPTKAAPPTPTPQPVRARAPQIRSAPPDPAPETKADVPVPSGGDEVVRMDDIAPAATGVAVAPGKPSTGRVGRGGTGGGTGSGTGSGSGDEPPMSVATIKTRALPRGDTSYFSAGKDYPAEARALGIEGAIRVRLRVDEHGKVTQRTLLNRLGHGLDELALARAAEIEFEPARDSNDQPVASVVVWTFTMTLPK